MGKAFFVADFYHRICGGILPDDFEAIVNCANEEGGVLVCKAAAGGTVSVGVNVEDVAGALAVIFLEPAAGLPGAGVFCSVGAGQVVDGDV